MADAPCGGLCDRAAPEQPWRSADASVRLAWARAPLALPQRRMQAYSGSTLASLYRSRASRWPQVPVSRCSVQVAKHSGQRSGVPGDTGGCQSAHRFAIQWTPKVSGSSPLPPLDVIPYSTPCRLRSDHCPCSSLEMDRLDCCSRTGLSSRMVSTPRLPPSKPMSRSSTLSSPSPLPVRLSGDLWLRHNGHTPWAVRRPSFLPSTR